jgi:Leucine-rich repeat (LRR) protein
MTKLFYLPLAAIIVAALAFSSRADEAKPADPAAPVVAQKPAPQFFPDKNLEAVIREITRKKTDKEEVKEDDLKTIYFLNGNGKKISNLAGLEKCINLADVKLVDNSISDLAPLAGLKNIQSLDLSKNKIADVTPLAKLEKLQYLNLESNQIEKLDGLKDLKKLTSLYLSKNKVVSLAPVAGLEKLWSLYLADNQVKDIAPVAKLKWLERLDLENNAVTDLSPLVGLTELRHTMLQHNQVADLAVLVEMAHTDVAGDKRFAPYWHLYLANNPLSDGAKGTQLAELKKLGVRVKME